MRNSAWCVLALAAVAHADPDLTRAHQQLVALDLVNASNTLKAVEAKSGLTRAEVLEFYELKGVVAGLTGKSAQAKDAFTRLLVLEPTHSLKQRYPPRVVTPFFEAKAVARESGALSLVVGATGEGISLSLSGATLALAARVRLELVEDGVARSAIAAITDTFVPTHAKALTVRARVVSAREWALLEAPELTFNAPPLTLTPPVVMELPVVAPIEGVVAPSGPRLRPLAYSLVGVGAAAAVVGAVFGVQSRSARSILDAPPMVDGRVTLTRAEARALDQQAVNNALIANALFISAGVLAVSGVIIWFLGLPDSKSAGLAW